LLPVGLAAIHRAIELNGVQVDTNKLAFALGRAEAAAPGQLHQLLHSEPAEEREPADLPALMDQAIAHLTAYQNAAYAGRYAAFVDQVREREEALRADPQLPFTTAVARSLFKLMACKDEYEVARLYTDGAFEQALREQFEGDFRLEFYLAPPILSHPKDGQPPRKIRFGGWMHRAMGLLARARVLRGTPLDVFGMTRERRMERALVERYRERVQALLPALAPENMALACEIAALPLAMRGFGHVKLANIAVARAREAELLHRFDPQAYPRPAAAPAAGQIRGIPIVREVS
jgi:indolepyruvate ferredoxin oxidoreductase